MILEIKKFKDPILRKKSEEVKEITDEIKKLTEDMKETMDRNQGVGLAAPQVGINKRIIVINPELANSDVFALINPKITKKSKETETEEEGCLCFPGLFLKIKRAKEIEIEVLNINGEKIKIKAQGLFARVLQHEIDHLDGILFIDRLGFWQRWKIRKKLSRESKDV